MAAVAPGPGLKAIAHIPTMRRDPLAYLLRLHAKYGDIVRAGSGPATTHSIANPDFADYVLRANHANYDRNTRSAREVRRVTGESILTTSAENWKRRRLTIQPGFQHDVVRNLEPLIAEETDKLLSTWMAKRQPMNVAAEMMHLTFTIAGRAFFGATLGDDAAIVERIMPGIMEEAFKRTTSPALVIRTIQRRRQDAAIGRLNEIIERLNATQSGTLAATLIRNLPPHEARNETLALLLAGHETTANALAWALYCIARHPELIAQLRAGDESLLANVIQETLRLYPPIWIVERRAIRNDEVGGYAIPAGSIVYVSPFVMHRDPRYWNDPDRFDPSRFVSGERPRSYAPFGLGPHHCVGSHFATLEMSIVIDRVVREFDLQLVTRDVAPLAHITLRPRGGVSMRVTPRHKSS